MSDICLFLMLLYSKFPLKHLLFFKERKIIKIHTFKSP